MSTSEQDLVYRLRKRAEIRRQIPDRKSVQEGKPDRIADLIEEAATEIEKLRETLLLHLKSNYRCKCNALLTSLVGPDNIEDWWNRQNLQFGCTANEQWEKDYISVYKYLLSHSMGDYY
jgi:hypothetical protein